MGSLNNSENGLQSPGPSRAPDVELINHFRNESLTRDPVMIARINQYLNDNKQQQFVDLNNVAFTLWNRHEEYRRRNWRQFMLQVQRAFKEVSTAGFQEESHDVSDSSEVEESNASYGDHAVNNSNSQLDQSTKSGEMADDKLEVIDLSSDDEPQSDGTSSKQSHPSNATENPREPQSTDDVTRIPTSSEGKEISSDDVSVLRGRKPTNGATSSEEKEISSDDVSVPRPRKPTNGATSSAAGDMPNVTFAHFGGSHGVFEHAVNNSNSQLDQSTKSGEMADDQLEVIDLSSDDEPQSDGTSSKQSHPSNATENPPLNVVSANAGLQEELCNEVEESNASYGDHAVNNSNSQLDQSTKSGEMADDKLEVIDLSSDDEPQSDGTSSKQSHPSNATENPPDDVTRIPTSSEGKEISSDDVSVLRGRKPTNGATSSEEKEISSDDVSVPRPRKPTNGATSSAAGDMPNVTFAHFGGSHGVFEEVRKLILLTKHPEVFQDLGVSAPRGFLLHGPPGCGKTLLASAIAGELKVPLIKVSCPELVGGISGESEKRVRVLFASALVNAPCVLFIDEVDAVTPNRQTAQREMERRIVAQLLTSLDDLAVKDVSGQVLVIGATKWPDALDPAFRRAGRFEREVCLGIPDEKAREEILRVLCAGVSLAQDLDLATIARMTPGFVGADLLSLIRESAMVAIKRGFEDLPKQSEEKRDRKRKRGSDDLPVLAKRSTCMVDERIREGDDAVVKPVQREDTMKKTVTNESTENNGNSEKTDQVAEKEEEKRVHVKEKSKESEQIEDISTEDMIFDVETEVEVESDQVEPTEKDFLIESEQEVAAVAEPSPLSTVLARAPALSSHQLRQFTILQSDLVTALRSVQPSAKREGFATVPDVTWDDVGSLASVREQLNITILGSMKYQAQFERLGLVAPAGILLCGPPGCGKTLLAKAVVNEAGINFISVKGPELLNMYVGESARAVRTVFQRARNSAPCVIFFDELDVLCPRRTEGDAGAGMRVVNQMLTEMDRLGERKGVFLMAATNRPDIVDPAVLRPGRFDRTLYIGLPNAADRKDILVAITKNGTKPPMDSDVSLATLATRPELDNWTGADLAALMREAAMQAVREATTAPAPTTPVAHIRVSSAHIEHALKTVRPSVSSKDLKRYEKMREQFAALTATT